MYFLICQPEDVLNFCWNINESQSVYTYKRYAYVKKCVSFSCINVDIFIHWVVSAMFVFFICIWSVDLRSFLKRQTSGTSNDNEWQRVVQRVTTNGNKWQWVVQRVTTNDNEWCNKWQRVTKSNTTSDNEWQQIAMSDSEWQSMKAAQYTLKNGWLPSF